MQLLQTRDEANRVTVFTVKLSDESLERALANVTLQKLKKDSEVSDKISDKLGYLSELAFILEQEKK